MTLAERLSRIADDMQRTDDMVGNPMGGERKGTIAQIRALAAECEQKVLVAANIQEHLGSVASDPPDVIYRASIAMFVSPHTDGGGLTATEALDSLQQRLNKEAFARGWTPYKGAGKK